MTWRRSTYRADTRPQSPWENGRDRFGSSSRADPGAFELRATCARTAEGFLCFASIRFRRCQITLPLFERDWQSLKSALRQHSLPKVQFAIKALPKDFSTFSERRIPDVSVK